MGIIGSAELLGQSTGPLLGGVITSGISWRWCFFINVPIGFVAICCAILLLSAPSFCSSGVGSWRVALRMLDWTGIATLLPGITLLCLALTWGGTTYPWSSRYVVGTLIGALTMLCAFAVTEACRKTQALLPFRMLKQRDFALGMAYAFCSACALGSIDYYVSLVPSTCYLS
jgi:MFS family permease